MTKLIVSVNKTEENQNTENNQNQYSLSKKIQKENTEQNQTVNEEIKISQVQPTEKSKQQITEVSSVDDISQWLLDFIGDGIFEQLKNNPYLQLPYTDDDIPLKEWLSRAVKTIFSKESIQQIAVQIQANQQKLSETAQQQQPNALSEAEKAAYEEKITKYNLRFQEFQNKLEAAEEEKHLVKRELQSSVPLSKVINEFYREPGTETEELKRLIEILNETTNNKDDSTAPFILRFSKGYFYLRSIFDQLSTDEKENLERVHRALTMLLQYISGIYIPERRLLLDQLAKVCSKRFTEYDFISPEQTLQIDPDIHNAQGMGSARIKEGITFAVLRRESKKAVKYADIRVS